MTTINEIVSEIEKNIIETNNLIMDTKIKMIGVEINKDTYMLDNAGDENVPTLIDKLVSIHFATQKMKNVISEINNRLGE